MGATENKNQLKLSVGRFCFYYYFAILTVIRIAFFTVLLLGRVWITMARGDSD